MIDSLVVDEITFEEIEKENEEYRKMIAEFNKGLHGDTSNKYKSSLAEEQTRPFCVGHSIDEVPVEPERNSQSPFYLNARLLSSHDACEPKRHTNVLSMLRLPLSHY